MDGKPKPIISIVIPMHNEEVNVQPMSNRLLSVITPLQSLYRFEVLFIDDGSSDGTLKALQQLLQPGLPFGYVQLSRNYGHQAALEAGLTKATGDAVITLDGDMQHPPELIPAMLEQFSQGADVVQMQRTNMTENIKGIIGMSFYKFFNAVSGAKLVPNAADFRLLSRKVVDAFLNMPGHGKVLRAVIPTLGFKQVRLEYVEEKRQFGTPSYTYFDLLELALHAVFKFSRFPAYFVTFAGIVLLLLGLVLGLLFATGAMHEGSHGFLVAVAMFLAGCIFFAAGILAFYLYFLLEQVRQVPHFVVSEVAYPPQKQ